MTGAKCISAPATLFEKSEVYAMVAATTPAGSSTMNCTGHEPPGYEIVTVALAALLGAVNNVPQPFVGATLPAEVLHVQLPAGDPAKVTSTLSPTPTFVLARFGGMRAAVILVIWKTLKPRFVEIVTGFVLHGRLLAYFK